MKSIRLIVLVGSLLDMLITAPVLADNLLTGTSVYVQQSVGGEFRNVEDIYATKVTLQKNIGSYHLLVKGQRLRTKEGAVDDKDYSLIVGDRIAFGVGYHSRLGTSLSVLVDEKYIEGRLDARYEPIRWGIGPILGVSHLNRHNGFKKGTTLGGRKTTAWTVGAWKKISKHLELDFTVTTRNNTQTLIDDSADIGVRYTF